MTTYKISGTISDAADVHVIQGDNYFGKKAVSAGAYEVTIDSTTPSGIIAVAEKSDGYVVGYGEVEAVTSSGVADLSVGGGASISSIQQADIVILSTELEGTATINSVDLDNSFLILDGNITYSDASASCEFIVELTNSTTITAARASTSYPAALVRVTVLEFSSGINSIQSGTIVQAGSTTYKTINSVDTSKAFVIHLGELPGVANQLSRTRCTLQLSNSTTITCVNSQENGTSTVGYMVVEFS